MPLHAHTTECTHDWEHTPRTTDIWMHTPLRAHTAKFSHHWVHTLLSVNTQDFQMNSDLKSSRASCACVFVHTCVCTFMHIWSGSLQSNKVAYTHFELTLYPQQSLVLWSSYLSLLIASRCSRSDPCLDARFESRSHLWPVLHKWPRTQIFLSPQQLGPQAHSGVAGGLSLTLETSVR